MDKEALHATLYSGIDEIPTLPALVPQLLSLIEEDLAGAEDIAVAIRRDPAMTAKILKVANSAYYGFSQKISGMDQAVPLLGLNMVKSLALSIGVVRALPSESASPHFSQEGLWIHSLAVATAIQELSRRLTHAPDGGDHYFIIGLLHDTGKVVLDQFFGDGFHQAPWPFRPCLPYGMARRTDYSENQPVGWTCRKRQPVHREI